MTFSELPFSLLVYMIENLDRSLTFCFIHILFFNVSCISKNSKMKFLRAMKLTKGITVLLVLLFIFFTVKRYYFSHPQSMKSARHEEGGLSSSTDSLVKEALESEDFGLFHIVTNFVPFTSQDLRKGLQLDGKPPTDQQLEARMAEIRECLQRNLNNSMIANVHVLAFGEETITYLESLKLSNSHKLILHNNAKWPTILDQLMYASKYLQGKMVVMCHQDNYIGKGWENVNHTLMMRKRLMYALTRHPAPSMCPGSATSFNCGKGYTYVGSHDTFVFFVRGPIDRHKFIELDVTPNLNLMENALMWAFKERLNYTILNPCKVLVVHHMHCISIREAKRKNIKAYKKGMYLRVPFTDQLQ